MQASHVGEELFWVVCQKGSLSGACALCATALVHGKAWSVCLGSRVAQFVCWVWRCVRMVRVVFYVRRKALAVAACWEGELAVCTSHQGGFRGVLSCLCTWLHVRLWVRLAVVGCAVRGFGPSG